MRFQVKYNPHYMKGTGMTAGDCIEHIWSDLRKFNLRCVYMGDAERQDLLSYLVSWWLVHVLVVALPYM